MTNNAKQICCVFLIMLTTACAQKPYKAPPAGDNTASLTLKGGYHYMNAFNEFMSSLVAPEKITFSLFNEEQGKCHDTNTGYLGSVSVSRSQPSEKITIRAGQPLYIMGSYQMNSQYIVSTCRIAVRAIPEPGRSYIYRFDMSGKNPCRQSLAEEIVMDDGKLSDVPLFNIAAGDLTDICPYNNKDKSPSLGDKIRSK